MLKNKKLIFIVLFFVAFLLLMSSNTFASTTVDFTHNDINFSVPVDFELKNYMVVYNDKSTVNANTYTLYNSDTSPIIYDLRIDNSFKKKTRTFIDTLEDSGINQVIVDIYMYDSSSNSFIFKESSSKDYYCNNDITLLYTNTEVWLRFIQDSYSYPITCVRKSWRFYSWYTHGDPSGGGDSTDDSDDGGGNTTTDSETAYNPGASWFDNIWNTLASIPNWLSKVVNALNPLSDDFMLKGVIDFLGNILSYINPLDDNFLLKGVLDFLGNIISYVNPFSDNFFGKTLINLFKDLLNSLFIMTAEQEQIHTNNQEQFNNAFNNKIPFVNSLIDTFEEVEQRQANVYTTRSFSSNPLNLSIGAFSYDSGVIHYNAPSTDLTFVLEKYEPYRITVRDGLKLLVYGLGIVYLVKYVLNYGITQGGNLGVDTYSAYISETKRGGRKK